MGCLSLSMRGVAKVNDCSLPGIFDLLWYAVVICC